VLIAVAANTQDQTHVYLLFANRGEGDILLRHDLDELEKNAGGRIKLHYTLEKV
jgi:NAD(P)H-flavin reductase